MTRASKETIRKIKKLRSEGMLLKDIAKELDKSYATVRNICSVYNITKETEPECCPNCGCILKDK